MCSDAGLVRHLPQALSQPSTTFFARFSLCHPERFAEAARVELGRGPLVGPWKVAVAAALHGLAVRTPDSAGCQSLKPSRVTVLPIRGRFVG